MMMPGTCTHIQFVEDDLTWYHQITVDQEHGTTYAIFPFDAKAVDIEDRVLVSDTLAHVLREDGVSLMVPWVRWLSFPGDDGEYDASES